MCQHQAHTSSLQTPTASTPCCVSRHTHTHLAGLRAVLLAMITAFLSPHVAHRLCFYICNACVCMARARVNVLQCCCFCRHRYLGQTKLVIGCPMISSPGNMRFWLHLCQASKAAGAEEAIQGFSTAAKAGKEISTAYCHEYNTELMRKVTRALWCHKQVVLLAHCKKQFCC